MSLETRFHLDTNGQDLAIEHVQDCTPILEANHEMRLQEQKSDWGRHKARIPNVIYVRWLNEEHAKGNDKLRLFTTEFDEIVDQKLKDPDWKFLLVDRPKLQVGGWVFDK